MGRSPFLPGLTPIPKGLPPIWIRDIPFPREIAMKEWIQGSSDMVWPR
jgi:hypothetical protein